MKETKTAQRTAAALRAVAGSMTEVVHILEKWVNSTTLQEHMRAKISNRTEKLPCGRKPEQYREQTDLLTQ